MTILNDLKAYTNIIARQTYSAIFCPRALDLLGKDPEQIIAIFSCFELEKRMMHDMCLRVFRWPRHYKTLCKSTCDLQVTRTCHSQTIFMYVICAFWKCHLKYGLLYMNVVLTYNGVSTAPCRVQQHNTKTNNKQFRPNTLLTFWNAILTLLRPRKLKA